MSRIDQAGEVAAHQHAAHLIGGHTVQGQQIGERHPVRNLVERRRSPGPGDRREERARRRRRCRADGRSPRRAGARRQIGQRLDVAHQCGKTRHTLFERSRGLVRRLGRAAVEDTHRRGLLAGHVARLDRHDADREPVEHGGVDFGQRRLDRLGGPPIGDVDVGASRVDHPRGEPAARRAPGAVGAQQPPVLDRRRLALLAVGDDNRAAAATAVVANGAQLDGQRERRAAAAEQSGQIDLAQQVIDIIERLIAAVLAILR